MLNVTIASVLITAIAAAAAVWTGYEAHTARLNDERPFLAVEPNIGAYVYSEPLRLQAYGRTPSINIRLKCSYAPIDAETLDWLSKEKADGPDLKRYDYLFPGEKEDIGCAEPKDETLKRVSIVFGNVFYQSQSGKNFQSPFCYVISAIIGKETRVAISCREKQLELKPKME